MKSLLIVLIAWMGFTGITDIQAQDRYTQAMTDNLLILDTAKSKATFQLLANNFERMANAESDKWLPYYYAAMCNVLVSYQTDDVALTDELLDKAVALKDKANEIKKNESEIYAMAAWIDQARIAVDPMTRGRKFSMSAGKLLSKASELDPSNPRPDYLNGSNLYYTPPMFGGGPANALDILQAAVDKYANFENSDPFWPDWGEENAKKLLQKCKEAMENSDK